MKTCMRRFLKILLVELEDLENDIEELVLGEHSRLAARLESDFVCMENVATLHNEEHGLHHFRRIMEAIDLNRFTDLDVLIAHLKEAFSAEVDRCGLARAAYVFTVRKMQHVEKYIKETDHWRRLHTSSTGGRQEQG